MFRASLPSSGRLSVCLFVCPSVTLVSCIKTVQARIIKSSPWTAPRSLVYRDKISCHWVQGFPSNENVEEGYPPKKDVILPLLARIMWQVIWAEIMRRAKAYSSSCSQVIVVYLHPFRRNSLFCSQESPKNRLKSIFLGFKVVQGHRCW